MAKITITNSQGLNQIKSGNGVVMQHTPTVSSAVGLVTTNSASFPGVYTLSGSGAAAEVAMPAAADHLGGVFIFRSLSPHAHVLTGSAEAGGTRVFTNGTTAGSKLALNNIIGSSVTLVSDDVNFCVLGNSGSLTLSGT